ncbi:peptidyl-prolyl cis-trans isomerase-like protein 10 [Sarcoptes scabiei]|uniref:Peptidyl-prolyl cis-trans isomerase n=1 Tax=Sarcoptes scabiei TaxID=52283 RepID=A0A132AJF6_SARSC|nr:peptidyl-prolyl cis-trans isomerase-like protein 10 [Sarcoptes scabiei]
MYLMQSIKQSWNIRAPKTCKNFAELSRRGYYDNTKFHRIIPDFIVQGGDPTATGRGGQSIYGPTFEDEITPLLKHTGAGILSMANAGPNTNGSQFFITLAPTQHLDGKHTIFGRVYSNLAVLKRICGYNSWQWLYFILACSQLIIVFVLTLFNMKSMIESNQLMSSPFVYFYMRLKLLNYY